MAVQLHKQMDQRTGTQTGEIMGTLEQNTSMSSTLEARIQSRMELARKMKEEEKLYRYNGVLYPVIVSPEENLKALETVEARDDDIILVAYPKCGKCKEREFLSMLAEM